MRTASCLCVAVDRCCYCVEERVVGSDGCSAFVFGDLTHHLRDQAESWIERV